MYRASSAKRRVARGTSVFQWYRSIVLFYFHLQAESAQTRPGRSTRSPYSMTQSSYLSQPHQFLCVTAASQLSPCTVDARIGRRDFQGRSTRQIYPSKVWTIPKCCRSEQPLPASIFSKIFRNPMVDVCCAALSTKRASGRRRCAFYVMDNRSDAFKLRSIISINSSSESGLESCPDAYRSNHFS